MFALLIAIFALVIAAVALAGVWLTTSGYVERGQQWELRQARIQTALTEMDAKIEKSASTTLRAEVDALGAALETLSSSNRKQFGKLWARIGKDDTPTDPIEAVNHAAKSDPEFQAMLRWQEQRPYDPEKA